MLQSTRQLGTRAMLNVTHHARVSRYWDDDLIPSLQRHGRKAMWMPQVPGSIVGYARPRCPSWSGSTGDIVSHPIYILCPRKPSLPFLRIFPLPDCKLDLVRISDRVEELFLFIGQLVFHDAGMMAVYRGFSPSARGARKHVSTNIDRPKRGGQRFVEGETIQPTVWKKAFITPVQCSTQGKRKQNCVYNAIGLARLARVGDVIEQGKLGITVRALRLSRWTAPREYHQPGMQPGVNASGLRAQTMATVTPSAVRCHLRTELGALRRHPTTCVDAGPPLAP